MYQNFHDEAKTNDRGPTTCGQDGKHQQALVVLFFLISHYLGCKARSQHSKSTRGAAEGQSEDGQRLEVASETPDQECLKTGADRADEHGDVVGFAPITMLRVSKSDLARWVYSFELMQAIPVMAVRLLGLGSRNWPA
jgi:hypothetical protein